MIVDLTDDIKLYWTLNKVAVCVGSVHFDEGWEGNIQIHLFLELCL